MAASGFDIDTHQLKSEAPTFHRESVALAKATEKLKHTLDGLGAPWGGTTNKGRSSGTSTGHIAPKSSVPPKSW